jgi:ATP citrate (pro-S)-lyase
LRETIANTLLTHVPAEKKDTLVLTRLYSIYVDLYFAYLEINPLVVLNGVDGKEAQVCYLNMAAKLDQTAESICGPKWAVTRDLTMLLLPRSTLKRRPWTTNGKFCHFYLDVRA